MSTKIKHKITKFRIFPAFSTVVFLVVIFSAHELSLNTGQGSRLSSVVLPTVQAANSTAKEIDQKEDQLKELNKKIDAYKEMIDLKKKQGSLLGTQIASLESQATKLQSEIDVNKTKLESLTDQVKALEVRIGEKTRLIESDRKLLTELLRSYYAQRDQMTEVAPVLLPVAEAKELSSANDWTGDVGSKITELLGNLDNLRDNLSRERDEIKSKQAEADTLQYQLERRSDYLDTTKQTKEVLAIQAQTDAKKYSSIVSNLQEQRDEIEHEIESLESAKTDQLDLSKLPGFGKALFIYPVKDPHLTQGYGKTSFAKKAYASGFHNGLDFGDSTGTPLYAAADGTVVGVGNNGKYAYGKWIAIDHDNGLTTLYGHLSAQSVSKGKKVKQGEKIGLMGSTGYSTGSHVHFTVFASNSYDVVESKIVSKLMIPTGATVNPKNYLPK